MALELRGICKSYSNAEILKNLNLNVAEGEFCVVVGQSGTGKTTILKILGGLETVQQGSIILNGSETWGKDGSFGMIFQEGNLLPWFTVQQNVELGLMVQKVTKSKRQTRAEKYLKMVGLEKHKAHFPHQISGGMRQLASLAQVLAYDPQVLLMDEPFASLDAQTRNDMQVILTEVWQKTKKTIIFVTHNVDEAVFLGERVVVLSGKPASFREDIRIDLPYPRIRTKSEFVSLRECILEKVRR